MNKEELFLSLANAVAGSPGWTFAKLADSIGIGKQYMSALVNKKKSPSDKVIARMNTIAKEVLPPEFFQDQVNITDHLTPKARAILEMIAKVEGVSESEAMNRAIEEFGANLLQKSVKKDEPRNENE